MLLSISLSIGKDNAKILKGLSIIGKEAIKHLNLIRKVHLTNISKG
jgi:hypothetical protein